jgi:hypothetical protein
VILSRSGSACIYGTMPSMVQVNLVSSGGQADYNHALGLAEPAQLFDVAGVGDGAFGTSAGPSARVWFYKGDTVVIVSLVAGLTPPPPTDLVIVLARTAASRI